MWKVVWVSEITKYQGEGEPIESKEQAQSWADCGNEKYPNITHIVVEVPANKANQGDGQQPDC